MFASNSFPDLSGHRKNEWNVAERERENGRDGFESFASISTKRARGRETKATQLRRRIFQIPVEQTKAVSEEGRKITTIRGKALLPPSMCVPCFQQNESTDFVPNRRKCDVSSKILEREREREKSNGDDEEQISNDVVYHRNGRTDEDNDTDRSVFHPLGLELLRGYPILSFASWAEAMVENQHLIRT